MDNGKNICHNCGGIMKQTGAALHVVYYKCPFCGESAALAQEHDSNVEYHMKHAELVRRINQSLFDYKSAAWEPLRRDIVDFMSRYQAATQDIALQMGLIMCLTKGYSHMDADIYKRCKLMYKTTQKMYKAFEKENKATVDPEIIQEYDEYRDHRKLYKKCRDEYRNTKLAWKGLFFVAKRLVPILK